MLFAAISFFATLLVIALLYPAFISVLARNRMGQRIASYGPSAHAVKTGTPTMGGLLFVAAVVVAAVIANQHRPGVVLVFALVAGATIGLVDDLANIRGRRQGLSAVQKLTLQVVAGVLLAIGIFAAGFTDQAGTPSLGWAIIPLAAFAVVACANAVNLTDGVDGLAATCAAIAFASLGIVALVQSNQTASIVSFATTGALLGFLLFNWHPARVFMGDTGALALGCLLVGVATQVRAFWLIPLLGIVFVAEALSVIINVTAITRFQKRVFKASPLHHHFEAIGFSERRVVFLFGAVSAIAGALTVLIMGAAS